MLAHPGPMLGIWAYVGLSWAHVGAATMLDHLGPILSLSWAYVGISWAHVEPMLAHLGAMLAHLGVHFVQFMLTRAHHPKIDYAPARRALPTPLLETTHHFSTFLHLRRVASSTRTKPCQTHWFLHLTHTKHRKLHI